MYHVNGEKVLRDGADVIQTNRYDIDHLCEWVKDVDGIVLRAPARITKKVIDANPNIKVIAGAGVGLDNIDVKYATNKGILVIHAPSVNNVSTAEHAIMLMMALGKNIFSFHNEMKGGNYSSRNSIASIELKGKKVGLIGFGKIAQEVAKRLTLAFEMDVTAWVREYSPEKHGIAKDLGVNIKTKLEEVFSQSDFVSIHIPLNEHTRNIIDRKLLLLMKPSAYLINTARGAVINQNHLHEVLEKGSIAGAGLDVFDPEPPAKNLPLLSLDNVIVTPHVGGTTVECNYLMSTTVAENVLKVLQGMKADNIGNPEVLQLTPLDKENSV
jgi:D-3-phosphoglycerate dehydrogenase / 2-oxoglutarate reductase